jgi:hypothetical protein
VSHWIELMNHPRPEAVAGFLPDDALHPSLLAILELVGSDAARLLLDAVRAFEGWADARPVDAALPPRIVGFHDTELRGVPISRYTGPYTAWMLQRPLDAYGALSADERRDVDRALAGTGCERLLAHAPRHRLAKRDYQLVFEHD